MSPLWGLSLIAAIALGCATRQATPRNENMKMLTDVRGSGRPLVLVGGGLTGWLSWVPHQERLAGTRRVLRVQPLNVQAGLDERVLPADYSVRMESAALAATLQGHGLDEPLDLVAWSYGALFTLDYALEHPERIRTLTLIEPPAYWVLEATERMDERSWEERQALAALHEEMQGDVTESELARFVMAAGFCPPGKEPHELPSWSVWLEHRRSLLQGPAVFAHRDEAARLRAFKRPVLLVKGTGSTHSFHRIIDVLAESLPVSRKVELPGGHAPQIASMDAFLGHLADLQDAH
jgi:pimeloyl-ACP methyl ester carboxylesterase